MWALGQFLGLHQVSIRAPQLLEGRFDEKIREYIQNDVSIRAPQLLEGRFISGFLFAPA